MQMILPSLLKDQTELDYTNEIFKMYEVSGTRLNQNKTEAVWMGSSTAPLLNIEVKEEIKLLGLSITNNKCAERTWGEKGNMKLNQ